MLLELPLSCFGNLLFICLKELLEDLIVTILVRGNVVLGDAHLPELRFAAWDCWLHVIPYIGFTASVWEINPALTAIRPCDLHSETRKHRAKETSTVPEELQVPGLS